MIITLLTPNELTDADRESLWPQGVNLDDWDYLVLAPVGTLCVNNDDQDSPYGQDDSTLEKLLTGACDNRWYKATFRGTEYALGIACYA